MPPPVIAATMTMNKRKMKQPQPQIAALKSADSEPHAIAHPSFEHFAFASIARVNIYVRHFDDFLTATAVEC